MSPPQSKFQLTRTPVKKITNEMVRIYNVYMCVVVRLTLYMNKDAD